MKKDYKPIRGKELREGINALGYPVKGNDPFAEAQLGLFLAMAQEIEGLRNELGIIANNASLKIPKFLVYKAEDIKIIDDTLAQCESVEAALKQECSDSDELMKMLQFDPCIYRTEGGNLNLPKIKAALAHTDDYPRMSSVVERKKLSEMSDKEMSDVAAFERSLGAFLHERVSGFQALNGKVVSAIDVSIISHQPINSERATGIVDNVKVFIAP